MSCTYADILAAQKRLRGHAHRTPVLTSQTLDRMTGSNLFFKCENFQKVGAFKFRGAANAIFSLTGEAAKRGVATHSSGNHAQAVALAARMRGIAAHIVMPRTVVEVKKAAVEGYGGRIVLCEPGIAAREEALRRVVDETGAEFIPPYDDVRVIAGQGTAALELLEDVPDLDVILTPVGGGGLLSGTAIVALERGGGRVIGVEPSAADDAYRSFRDQKLHPPGTPESIADGLLGALSKLTFEIILKNVDSIRTVSEDSIRASMRLISERMKLVVEPSGAVPLAALLGGATGLEGRRIGLILSGGNTA